MRMNDTLPLWLRSLRFVDRASRLLIFLCVGLYVGVGCVPMTSKIDQHSAPPVPSADTQPSSGIKLIDQPISATGPQAGVGNIAASVQTYMPWTLVLLLLFNTLIHNSTVRFITQCNSRTQEHTIDTMATLTQTVQQQQSEDPH